MARCPWCESTDTIPVLYGMPTYEAFEASERGELEIGGCLVLDPDGRDFVCKACAAGFTEALEEARSATYRRAD
jgi:hypothetical protein